jgi:hypothetical protein
VLHKGWWKVWAVRPRVVMVEAGHTAKGKRRSNKVRFWSSVGLYPILLPRGVIRGDLNSTYSDHGLLFHRSDMRGAYVFLLSS